MDAVLDLFNKHTLRIAAGVNVILVVMLGLSVASAIVFFLENNKPQFPHSESMQRSSTDFPRSSAAVSDIAGLNLFGKLEQIQQEARVVDAPITRLNLSLNGIFAAENPAESGAIIAEARKNGELYKIGDTLPGNAKLHAVLDDHVLIKRGAKIEKLMFTTDDIRGISSSGDDEEIEATGSRFVETNSRLQEVRRRILNRNQQKQAKQGDVRERATSNSSNLRQVVNDYQERLESDPAGVLQELGVAPVSEGESSGYKVGNNISNRALQQAGLQQGDVILSVNGRPVGDVGNDAGQLQQVLASKRVRVEIQRDSRRFFLTVPIP